MTEVQTLTLAEFLLARIREDVEQATAGEHWDLSGWSAADDVPVQFWDYGETHIGYRRFLAECASKLRIVERCRQAQDAAATINGIDFGDPLREARERSGYNQAADALSYVLFELAQPYADHPDFRDEWRL